MTELLHYLGNDDSYQNDKSDDKDKDCDRDDNIRLCAMITLGDEASSLCAPQTKSPLGPLCLQTDWIFPTSKVLIHTQENDELLAQNAT